MILILNCDFDEAPQTNGARLIDGIVRSLADVGTCVVDIHAGRLPTEWQLTECEGVIITGSRASVYEKRPWIPDLLRLIRRLHRTRIPTFAVCFGFQAVAQALGGSVGKGQIVEEGFTGITVTTTGQVHPLFIGLPSRFDAYESHGDTAMTLPAHATILARNEHYVQSYCVDDIWCVHFHPEISPAVAVAMARRDGDDADAALNGVGEDYAVPLRFFRNFLARVAERKE